MASWASRKQETVALSSAEAEYVAASRQAAQEPVWLRQLLKGLGFEQTKAILIYEDNQSGIALTKNPVKHSRTKHIDIRWDFAREKVQSKQLVLKYIPTNDK